MDAYFGGPKDVGVLFNILEAPAPGFGDTLA
jgi:hypothetical protein